MELQVVAIAHYALLLLVFCLAIYLLAAILHPEGF
jgi:K+-transporting ATPase KdpF subunit